MFLFLLSLLLLALNIYILVYLFRLEGTGCECAMGFRRTYAIAYIIASFVYSVLMAGVDMYLTAAGKTPEDNPALVIGVGTVSFAMLAAGIAYVILSVQYINRLRDEKCACSDALARDVWEVVLYIKIALYAVVALQFVIALVALTASPAAGSFLRSSDTATTSAPSSSVKRNKNSARR